MCNLGMNMEPFLHICWDVLSIPPCLWNLTHISSYGPPLFLSLQINHLSSLYLNYDKKITTPLAVIFANNNKLNETLILEYLC